ncbi:MAG: hypothetical protein M0Z38_01130 [Deltaproteobacteria bacterium]|nr:hypothetical protein [Deltaproteobacteria bacterium]
MNGSRIRTAVLHAAYTDLFSYYDDWKDAFLRDPGFDADAVNVCDRRGLARLADRIGEYDLVVLLHSTNADTLEHVDRCRGMLCRRRGKLLSFVGNEVNLPGVSLGGKIDFLREVGAEFIGTQLPLDAGQWLYEECRGSRVVPLPHALNPEAFRPVVPQAAREIDIGARSHQYLPFLGDDERNRMLGYFLGGPFDPPMRVDIDTRARLNREGWAAFLNRCKGTIATEAGSYYLERDDRTVRAIQDYVNEKKGREGVRVVRKGSLLEKAGLAIPRALRRRMKGMLEAANIRQEFLVHQAADYEEIRDRFFADLAKPPVYTKAISSRHFDAIGAKTCQIMFPGRFNGILRADEHYLALQRDFSNVRDVLSRFADGTYRAGMADRAYEYVMEEHTYRNRLSVVRKLLEEPGGG